MAFQQCHTKSVNRNINKVMKRWILFRTKYSEDLESTVRKIFLVIDILFFLSHLYQAVVSFIGICNGYKQGLCFISSFSFCSVSHSLNVLFISVPHAFSSSALRKLTCPPLKKSSWRPTGSVNCFSHKEHTPYVFALIYLALYCSTFVLCTLNWGREYLLYKYINNISKTKIGK